VVDGFCSVSLRNILLESGKKLLKKFGFEAKKHFPNFKNPETFY